MTTKKTNGLLSALLDLFRPRSTHRSSIDGLKSRARDDAGDDRARIRLGDLYAAAGNDAEAVLAYMEAARINVAKERHDRAAALWRRVLSIEPDCVRALVELARAKEALGHRSEASAAYRRAAAVRTREGFPDEAFGLRRRADELALRNDAAAEQIESTRPYAPGEIEGLMIDAAPTQVNLHAAGMICRFPFDAVPQA